MKIKKALPLAIASYLMPFVITVAAALVITGTARPSPPNPVVGAVGLVSTVAILVSLTRKYLKIVKPSMKEGFLFGLLSGVAGIVIDTIYTVAVDATRPMGNLADMTFWVALVIVVAIAAFVGFYESRKAKTK